MKPGRYRCHAALMGGVATIPALVTVKPDGSISVSRYSEETHSTTDINGVIIAVPEGHHPSLPQSLPPHGLTESLSKLPVIPASEPMFPILIPIMP
ncbi:MAG: hypothetical protein NC039_07020 [Muribaculaceae bacterium]|nr:hypothetical protein [Muribaculaceae bacterium]